MQRRNINLRVVRDAKRNAETDTGDDLQQEFVEMVMLRRVKSRKKIMMGFFAFAAVIIAIILVIYLQTYTKVRVSDTYAVGNASDNNYEEFAKGVLKYSRDGISYLNQKGEEQWNQPYQMKNPFVEVNSKSAAVADKGGNDIMVFGKEGTKGEILTTLPIEKIAVSEQGIVAAVLKNESAPKIICYDTAGNILVEHKASLTGTGYPLDIALSADGMVMQVVYLSVGEAEAVSKVCYYNFGEAGESKPDHLVMEKEYKGSILGSGFYMGGSTSAVVGDNCLTIFNGKDVPKENVSVSVKGEIQCLFYNEKYIGMIIKPGTKSGYELCLYNTSGKKVFSQEINSTYKSAKVSGSQIILYDGKKCSIYSRMGIHLFEGAMDHNILEIFPTSGVNKYIVMNANGMENVRLVK